ncbi:translation initiation factor eIF-2B alpha subunit [Planoprotostelium fungivorum]|uniref:Translation initiation factor eIF2B subunit alpha n=1 Tax=Planoprotostelium fungivorum TaxID=1890364 RepID=A0A2P6NI72_9EUKA|nr:translation initiation factor eIF-2B alpha subunit [Planoprotostelium fungivorum]
MAAAVAAVGALTEVIRVSRAQTMMQLEKELKSASEVLKDYSDALSVASGCDLFTRFVLRASGDYPNFDECKKKLIAKGQEYVKISETSRNKIGSLAAAFIRDGMTVLIHGYSRVVMAVLARAVNDGKRFSVYVTEARPKVDDTTTGSASAAKLQEMGVPVTLVLDSAVAYIMDHIDLVFVGAEGIVENGGIINKVGTYQVSIIAKACGKPFYVAAESFKFMRLYPLNQKDIGKMTKDSKRSTDDMWSQKREIASEEEHNKIKMESPSQDYTPPRYINLLFTELGVLTPAAVSDELIKLHY